MEKINILIGSDINYAPYYGVMLYSLFVNNKNSCFEIYLLTDESWTNRMTRKFEKLTAKHKSHIHVIKCDSKKVMNLPIATHITPPAYYHLQASKLLPNDIHKILYLDGDMIINQDITSLWDIDLTNYSFAGVEDCSCYNEELYNRMGYERACGYVNNGVMLYNLDYLRKTNFAEESIAYAEKYPERITWMDQDLDNIILKDKKYALPPKYNFQNLFLIKYHWKNYSKNFKKQILDDIHHPIIVHYCGRIKPWHFKYHGLPFEELWNKYYKQLGWHFVRSYKPISKYIKYIFKRLFLKQMFVDAWQREYIEESKYL